MSLTLALMYAPKEDKGQTSTSEDMEFESENMPRDPFASSGSGKKFECLYCYKGFNKLNKLKEHEAMHTGERRPFDCEECGKKFKRADHLKTHMRRHTEEKPFNCQHCDKTFGHLSNLYIHQKKCF